MASLPAPDLHQRQAVEHQRVEERVGNHARLCNLQREEPRSIACHAASLLGGVNCHGARTSRL